MAAENTGSATVGGDWALSSLLAVFALSVFAALPQRAFHGFDTDWYATLLQAGAWRRSVIHAAYLPLCELVFAVVRPLGFGAVHAMLWTAAVGSALGVLFLHRAARLLVEQASPAAVAVAVALTPACFYFATAAEIHGVFAAGSGAAWWAFARWRNRPGIRRALVLGVACGIAASIHSFGNLLSPMFVLVGLVERRATIRQLLIAAIVVFVSHLLVVSGLALALGHGLTGQMAASSSHVGASSGTVVWSYMPGVVWREFTASYLPWSVLAVAGLWHRRARTWSIVFLACVVIHAPITLLLLLARGGENFHERGGYLLPVALPAVLAAAALLPRAWFRGAVAIGAVLSLVVVAPRWPAVYRDEFVDGVIDLRRERDFALLVGPRELEGVRTRLEGVVCFEVDRSLAAYFGLTRGVAAPDPLPQWFDAMLLTMPPSLPVLVTVEAQRCMLDSPNEHVRALWRDHVPDAYLLEPVQRLGLEGVWLRRRP